MFLKNRLPFPWNVKSGATYDLAIMLLIIYAKKKWKHMSTQKLVCKYSEKHHSDSQNVEKTQVFISRWWVNKMCSIHTTEYYSAMKRSEVLTSATERMILESITLSEGARCKGPWMIWFYLFEISRAGKSNETEN